ncbi:MAG: RNA polymerase sigma factor [Candidatus Geothermincolia bacterium]
MTLARGPEQALEDRELIEQAKQDRSAFDALYSKYLSKIYSYIYYRVRNVEEAEDITENVFLHALLHLDRYRHMGLPFSAWLLRIAHNLVANWYRDRGKRSFVELDQAEYLQDGGKTPEECAEASEERELLRHMLAQLSEERQQALVLRYAEGMKHREIGEVMGKSAVAVKVMIHRSINSLQKAIHSGEIEGGAIDR